MMCSSDTCRYSNPQAPRCSAGHSRTQVHRWTESRLDHGITCPSGGIGAEALALSAVGVPTILAATLLGSWGAGRVRQERFADLVSALLCVAGAVTLLRALT